MNHSAVALSSPTLHNLAMNEETLGPAPEILEVLKQSPLDLPHYPDPQATQLRETLAQWKGLNASQIICGNGSEELIYLIAQNILKPGDRALANKVSFSAYARATRNARGKFESIPNPEFETDVPELLAGIGRKTKLIFLDNPGNPTSTYMGRKAFEELYHNLPPSVLLVVDEAYHEYLTHPEKFTALDYVKEDKLLLVLRTFSKFYGLAGIRCGWGYGPEWLIKRLYDWRTPLSMNTLAHSLVGAATRPLSHYDKVRERNTAWRRKLSEFFKDQGCWVPESHTNFISVQFPTQQKADTFEADCQQARILVHRTSPRGALPFFRISLGSDEALTRLMNL